MELATVKVEARMAAMGRGIAVVVLVARVVLELAEWVGCPVSRRWRGSARRAVPVTVAWQPAATVLVKCPQPGRWT